MNVARSREKKLRVEGSFKLLRLGEMVGNLGPEILQEREEGLILNSWNYLLVQGVERLLMRGHLS